jgi:hypothetical protein
MANLGAARDLSGAGGDPQMLGMQDTAMDNRVGEPCGSIQDLARNFYSARAF